MFGGVGKRAFVRTEISTIETVTGIVVLALVVSIGIGVYIKGQHYDVNLFALDQDLLVGQAPAREQVKLFERSAEGGVVGRAEEDALFDGLAPEGWRLFGAVESFTAETLYEKINGRDEQYLAYDVVGLQVVGFAAAAGQFIDVFIYDMGAGENAFGVYAVERPEDAVVEPLGREGYRVESSFFFWKGNYYVQVVASDIGAEIQAAAAGVTALLVERLQGDGAVVWGLDVLPAKDRVAVQYYKRDALSLDFLQDTYTAQYRRGEEEWTAFVSRQDSPTAAAATMESYLAYLTDYAEVSPARQVDGVEVVTGDMGGFYDVIFRSGSFFGGVNLAEGRELAERGADELLRVLKNN